MTMYSTPVTLARQHLPEIAQEAVELIQAAQLEYYRNVAQSDLMQFIVPTFEQYLHYLETGNISCWKDFCTDRITLRYQQGFQYDSVIEVNKILLQALRDFFREQLVKLEIIDEQPAIRVLQSLENRLVGLNSVAITTATAVGMRLKRSTTASDN